MTAAMCNKFGSAGTVNVGAAPPCTWRTGASSGQFLGAAEATAFPSGSPANMLASVSQVTYNASGLPSGVVHLA
jgi:hypothetical protein